MKNQYVKEFFKIGLMAAGGGPLILAIVYLALALAGEVQTLSVQSVILGIFSSLILAFICGGISVVYRMEKLPLLLASFLHVCVLYVTYLSIYLLNGWLVRGAFPILVFTLSFFVIYFAVWLVVYACIKRQVNKLNQKLK